MRGNKTVIQQIGTTLLVMLSIGLFALAACTLEPSIAEIYKEAEEKAGGGKGKEVSKIDIAKIPNIYGGEEQPGLSAIAVSSTTPKNVKITRTQPHWYANASDTNPMDAEDEFVEGTAYHILFTITVSGNNTFASTITATPSSVTVTLDPADEEKQTALVHIVVTANADPTAAITAVAVSGVAAPAIGETTNNTSAIQLKKNTGSVIPHTSAKWIVTLTGNTAPATFAAGTAYSLKIEVENYDFTGLSATGVTGHGGTGVELDPAAPGTAKLTITIAYAATESAPQTVTVIELTDIPSELPADDVGDVIADLASTVVVAITPGGSLTYGTHYSIGILDDQSNAVSTGTLSNDTTYFIKFSITSLPAGHVFNTGAPPSISGDNGSGFTDHRDVTSTTSAEFTVELKTEA